MALSYNNPVVTDTKPIPVRLSANIVKRLEKVAATLGSNRTAVIKLCLKSFLDDFERHGKSMLPPNYLAIFAGMDGRTNLAQSEMDKTAGGLVAGHAEKLKRPHPKRQQ